MTLIVLLEQGEANWAASSTDDALDGNFVGVTAATRDEAIAKFRQSLRAYFEYMESVGRRAPLVTSLEVRELLPA